MGKIDQKVLTMMGILIGELDDAVDFMNTFEGYEDEDAIKRRERKVKAIEEAEKIYAAWYNA